MKIQIITSCTGAKLYSPANQLKKADFLQLHNKFVFASLENTLSNFLLPAIEMYTGHQHTRLVEGIVKFQSQEPQFQVDLWVLSAGYGLIPGSKPIAPYECTFQKMKIHEIHDWSAFLRIPEQARNLFAERFDLRIVLLGEKYLRSLMLDDEVIVPSPTLFLAGKGGSKLIKGKGQIKILALSLSDSTRFSCGMVGLKGEIAKRILALISESDSVSTVINSPPNEVLALLD